MTASLEGNPSPLDGVITSIVPDCPGVGDFVSKTAEYTHQLRAVSGPDLARVTGVLYNFGKGIDDQKPVADPATAHALGEIATVARMLESDLNHKGMDLEAMRESHAVGILAQTTELLADGAVLDPIPDRKFRRIYGDVLPLHPNPAA